ncbi:MAG: tyrosine protein kinase, partial [Bacillota bacterium]|nr:tyrosine protein kinase [Bacillota bacterium]
LIDVKDQLEQTGCPIIGTVLNMVEYDNYLSRKYYYKSYYSNYESREDSTKQIKSKAKKEIKVAKK